MSSKGFSSQLSINEWYKLLPAVFSILSIMAFAAYLLGKVPFQLWLGITGLLFLSIYVWVLMETLAKPLKIESVAMLLIAAIVLFGFVRVFITMGTLIP